MCDAHLETCGGKLKKRQRKRRDSAFVLAFFFYVDVYLFVAISATGDIRSPSVLVCIYMINGRNLMNQKKS